MVVSKILNKTNCFGVVILFNYTLIHEIVAKKSMFEGKDNYVLIISFIDIHLEKSWWMSEYPFIVIDTTIWSISIINRFIVV